MYLSTIMSYIILGEYIACLILQFYTILIFGSIITGILRKTQTIRLSFSFLIYIILATAFASTAFIMLTYNIIFWKPTEADYNTAIFWWLGAPCFVTMGTISTSVLFLGIERCLLLLFPYDFDETKRKIFAIFEVLFIFGLILLYLFVNILSEIPTIERTTCYAYGCMMTEQHKTLYDHRSLYIYVRYVIALLNCILGSILFFIFYQKSKQSQINGQFVRNSRNNKLVLSTIAIAFLFDFLPHFAAFCSKTFFNVNPNQYIGPYGTFFTTLDVVICAEVSRRIFATQKAAFVATPRIRLHSSFRLPRTINIKQ